MDGEGNGKKYVKYNQSLCRHLARARLLAEWRTLTEHYYNTVSRVKIRALYIALTLWQQQILAMGRRIKSMGWDEQLKFLRSNYGNKEYLWVFRLLSVCGWPAYLRLDWNEVLVSSSGWWLIIHQPTLFQLQLHENNIKSGCCWI